MHTRLEKSDRIMRYSRYPLDPVIVKPLINSDKIVFYKRYVDDTLVLTKPSDIEHILNTVNTFDSQMQFTVNKFPDNDKHFDS